MNYFHLFCSKTRTYLNDKGFGFVKYSSGSKITHKCSPTHQWDCSTACPIPSQAFIIGASNLAQRHMLIKSKMHLNTNIRFSANGVLFSRNKVHSWELEGKIRANKARKYDSQAMFLKFKATDHGSS